MTSQATDPKSVTETGSAVLPTRPALRSSG